MRIQSKLALLATLAFPALSLAAYSMNLSGKVVDAGGQGVAQVEIALKGTELKATTDASGAWVLQQESAALLGPTLAAARALSGEQGAYSVSGRKMGNTRQLAQGVYVQKSAKNVLRNQALAKEAGENDSLIVSYQGAEVGRLEQADLLQGALPDFMLLTVVPTLTQGTDNSSLASQFRLLGQTVLVNYVYDASLWRSSVLTVGATQSTITDLSQKQFRVALGAKEDAAVNLALATRLQTITEPVIADPTYGDAAFDVSATASSGLPVSIVSTTLSVCSVSNGQVNLLAAGSCALKATQAGNADYNAVEVAFKAFAIVPKTLTVSTKLGASLSKVYDGTTVNSTTLLKDTHYELTGVVGTDVVDITVTGATYNSADVTDAVSATAPFSDALTGADAGNYQLVAGSFSIPATISKATLAFTSTNPGSQLLANSPVTHTFSSPLSVSIVSTTPSVCEYASGSLTLKTAGLCTITATPNDAANYQAASQTFGVDQLYDERDGALYNIVKIDNQVWMAENLNYSAANTLGLCKSDADNSAVTTNTSYCDTYGRVYNYTTALTVCPTGWHLPTDAEWTTLVTYLGATTAGTQLKSASALWTSGGIAGTNTSQFSALPGGYYDGGSFVNVGNDGYWWTATPNGSSYAYSWSMYYDRAAVYRYYCDQYYGFSVRCLKD